MEVLFRELVKLPSTSYATHGLYMYPARFIPHVVRYAVERYTEPGDWVFDPFAGYGSVAIEASLTGRNAVLWDLNPITHVFVYASIYRGGVSINDFEISWDYSYPFHSSWENIFYWHPREFYEVLSRAWGYWHYKVYERSRSFEELSRAFVIAIPLLKITRFFSYSDENIAKTYRSRYAEEKVAKLLASNWRSKLFEMYREASMKTLEKIWEFQRLGPRNVKIIVRTSWKESGRLEIFDSLRERLDRDVRLMITSPPYLQAQEYIRSFKIELAWLGYSGVEMRMLADREIPYNKSPPAEVNSSIYREYRSKIASLKHPKLLELYETYFKSLAHFLNNNAERCETIAMFVGPVKVRNIRIPIDEILREHLESLGFKHVETLIDRIVSRRLFNSKINPATGLEDERTPTEHLLVMRGKR
jgi:hypothetical protein